MALAGRTTDERRAKISRKQEPGATTTLEEHHVGPRDNVNRATRAAQRVIHFIQACPYETGVSPAAALLSSGAARQIDRAREFRTDVIISLYIPIDIPSN